LKRDVVPKIRTVGQVRVIESELVAADLAEVAMPDIPAEIAD
jgi:hypothetical protein